METLIPVIANNSDIMRSYESANLQITSPSGKTIYIKKSKVGKFSKSQQELFWKMCNDTMIRFVGEMKISLEDMKELLAMSKIY